MSLISAWSGNRLTSFLGTTVRQTAETSIVQGGMALHPVEGVSSPAGSLPSGESSVSQSTTLATDSNDTFETSPTLNKPVLFLSVTRSVNYTVACSVESSENDKTTLHSLHKRYRELCGGMWRTKQAVGVKFFRVSAMLF